MKSKSYLQKYLYALSAYSFKALKVISTYFLHNAKTCALKQQRVRLI